MIGQATRPVAHQRLFAPSQEALRQLAALLVAAAVAETLLLRLATRVGVHVPRGEAARTGIHAASLLGTLALNLASVLAIGLVVLVLALLVLRREGGPGRLVLATLSAGMLWGLGSTLTTDSLTGDALFGLTMTLLVVGVGVGLAWRAGLTVEARLAIGLMEEHLAILDLVGHLRNDDVHVQDLPGDRLRDVGHAHRDRTVRLRPHPDLVLVVVVQLRAELAATKGTRRAGARRRTQEG